jgi:type I restriction enzyme S subunit
MLLCFLNQIDMAPYVTGAVQPKLNQKNLKAIPFPASDPAVVEAFGTMASQLFERVRKNSEETRTLVQTRDLLLPKLMSGEVRLSEAEKLCAEIA